MLGVQVLQVYGLTETTAICTMDDPRNVVAGRVGPVIPEVEMRLGEIRRFWCAGQMFFPSTGIVRKRRQPYCATVGSTPAIRAK